MADVKLTKTRVRAGVWEGILSTGGAKPTLDVLHLEQKLPGLVVTEMPGASGTFAVRLPIPASVLNEGVQTFLFRDSSTGETLTHFTIVTGVAMEDDLRAEVDLLRAELDMLKRAFRRHCLETMG
ncbi:hypothetical protein KM031_06955 [Gemmobacter fulvus]|uniref:Uncharacterized protein n=1 Tax=Gemmobacter fulvus TaxID=2840474 RepID=A0A975S1V6_9RHOB|nr:hypothetical protein [Gemmobacter fulvus]MBT9244761.1 hypothetical protein [Gemmobacter fulvus]MDQ1848709.1 hypothetical protein [Gemmobacter fulvus]QWK91609.1 hypothetical protein KM031_06955 [Gemmobacter fulvus]